MLSGSCVGCLVVGWCLSSGSLCDVCTIYTHSDTCIQLTQFPDGKEGGGTAWRKVREIVGV